MHVPSSTVATPRSRPAALPAWVFLFGLFGLVLLTATPANAGKIGVDAIHGFNPIPGGLAFDSRFDRFRQVIQDAGHEIVPLRSFLPLDLEGLDGLIVHQAYLQNSASYTPEEIAAIHDFVATGGGLLVQANSGDGSDVDNLNLLVEPYGLRCAAATINPNMVTPITGFVLHHLTDGVRRIALTQPRPLDQIDFPGFDLTVNGNEVDLVAIRDGQNGSGTVVYIADTNLWKDPDVRGSPRITDEDNLRFAQNIIREIARPPCVLDPTVGTVNRGRGISRNVLFVNNSAGSGPDRIVEYNVNDRFELRILAPPALPLGKTAPFAVYVWGERPQSGSSYRLPFLLGCMRLPPPMVGGSPQPLVVFNNAGQEFWLGEKTRPSNPAPSILVRRERLRTVGRFYAQGILFDPGSASPIPASITNGVTGVPVFQ